jgi:TolB protein
MKTIIKMNICIMLSLIIAGCDNNDNGIHRNDGAQMVEISEGGSFQNPAWSPESNSLVFTRFRNGYNQEPADLFILSLDNNSDHTLVSDGSGNVNLPGSVWNETIHKILFSSSRDPHDEIYMIDENGSPGNEEQVTNRIDLVAYEPSFSPDGTQIVFESHELDVEDNGIITKFQIGDPDSYEYLTDPGDDCRQPNWSPAEDLILYQKYENEQWDIWTMEQDGSNKQKVTNGPGDKTDASFSPDGQSIVYSSEHGELEFANIYIIPVSGGTPVRVTCYEGYDGAPDTSPGTTIWIIDVPDVY